MPELPYEKGTPSDWDAAHVGKLQIVDYQHDGETVTVLQGPCPRCTHPIQKALNLSAPMLMPGPRGQDPVVVLTCNCGHPHKDQPADAEGCGAEGGVRLSQPPTPVELTEEQRRADAWVEKAYGERLTRIRELAGQWQTTLGTLTALLGVSTVVGGTGVRDLTGHGPAIYGVVALLAVLFAASATYAAFLAGTRQVVDGVPADADGRRSLQDTLYNRSQNWLIASKVLALIALLGFVAAIAFLWYAPAKEKDSTSTSGVAVMARNR